MTYKVYICICIYVCIVVKQECSMNTNIIPDIRIYDNTNIIPDIGINNFLHQVLQSSDE